ncbi:MAG: hypothetical protein ACQERF_03660 [Actinomycetota bacterium]
MGLTRLVLVVLMIGVIAFMVTLSLRSRRVVPTELAMERALARLNTTTLMATVGGLAFALWAWFTLPVVNVDAAEVPGLLAALGPVLAGLVYLAITAAGEASWRAPSGPRRTAVLTRRPLFSRAAPWANHILWAWAALLTAALVAFGAVAEPDGRSIAHVGGACVVDGATVPCTGASGPFPGWPYGIPLVVGAALVVAATLGVLSLIARRPAVRDTIPADDELLRTISATRVVRGAQLSLGATLAGVLLFAGTAAANAGWGWAWPAIIGAAAVLGTSFAVTFRRVGP